jgi:hypothetical protein
MVFLYRDVNELLIFCYPVFFGVKFTLPRIYNVSGECLPL